MRATALREGRLRGGWVPVPPDLGYVTCIGYMYLGCRSERDGEREGGEAATSTLLRSVQSRVK